MNNAIYFMVDQVEKFIGVIDVQGSGYYKQLKKIKCIQFFTLPINNFTISQ